MTKDKIEEINTIFKKNETMQLLKHFKILKDQFAPVLEFQEEIKRRGGDILADYDVYEAIVNSRGNIEVKNRLLNLVFNNYSDECQKVFRVRKVYYLKNAESIYQITVNRPSESEIESGEAKYKISLKDNQLITILNPSNSVLVERPKGDMAIIFNDKYSNIPSIINSLNPIENQNNNMNKLGVKKLTSTFWLCFSIILVGLLFCGTYYLVNKDNGRYQYESGLVIDKKTGEAKPIEIKRD